MRSSPPLISVLLPVFNAGETIERAVRSLQRQTIADWELIAVDDGSSDDSAARIGEMAASDPRIRLLEQDHAGVVAAANTALGAARGHYLARMDADDEAAPGRFEAQLTFLREEPRVDIASCQVRFGGARRAAEGFARHVDWINQILTPEQHRAARFLEYPLANPTLFASRAAWLQVGPTREGAFPEDYDWFLRAQEEGLRFGKVPTPLLTWNDPPTRLTRNDPRYDRSAFFALKIPFLARCLRAQLEASRPILLWGAGRTTRQRLRPLFAEGLPLAGWIEVDPRKIGQRIGGLPVHGPEVLDSSPRPFILPAVGSRGARARIEAELRRRGFRPEDDYFLLA